MEVNAGARQPVHTVYGGAHRFKADTVPKLGAMARETMRTLVPHTAALVAITGMNSAIAAEVHERVAAKLEREPIEDFRIDFEDGYGYHSDADEDRDAAESSRQLAGAIAGQALPPFIGVRIKAFSDATLTRARRTLDLFMDSLLASAGEVPREFVITLPKVTTAAQVKMLHDQLVTIEARHRLTPNAIRIEIMVEMPQVIVNAQGCCEIPALLTASGGRCRGMHFGPYDYTSALGIASSRQHLHHPSCVFARHVMQAATAGTGVFLSDGPTKLIPQRSSAEAAHHAMKAQYDDIRRSLDQGFYQGWDLHPSQLPMRYAAVYSFFEEGLSAATERLRNFLDGAAQATLLGTVFDDTASAQGLLNFFHQGWSCGALTEAEVSRTGLTPGQLRSRSL